MRHSRSAFAVILSLIIAAFLVNAVVQFSQVRKQANGLMDFPGEAAMQALQFQVNIERLLEFAALYVLGDPQTSQEKVQQEFDLTWSRATIIREGPIYRDFFIDTGMMAITEETLAGLEALDDRVQGLRRGDRETLALIRERLLPIREKNLSESNVARTKLRDAVNTVNHGLIEMFNKLATTAIGLALCICAAFAAYMHSLRRGRRIAGSLADEEARRLFMADHDALTGLANRDVLMQRLEQIAAQADEESRHHALLLLDLDGFKNINDSLGHSVGDGLLCVVADRLRHIMRPSDLVARLGGDEFALLARLPKQQNAAAGLATRAIEEIGCKVGLDKHDLHVTTSVGIALVGRDGLSGQELLAHADLALYQAKETGRNRFCFFDQRFRDAALQRKSLETDLREALEKGHFAVYLQPKISLKKMQVVGAEALIRWHHPTRGWVSPMEFIPVAEQTGMILEIGERVMQEACEMAARWTGKAAGLEVAVNVSAVQFAQQDIVALIRRVLADTGLQPERLSVEITESVLMQDTSEATTILLALNDFGVRVALDDFGTGYSNLLSLRRLPINELKIDREFVRDIERDPDDRAIVAGILGLASSLRLDVIAEGVETAAHEQFLLDHGCELVQGYHYAPALPEEEFIEFIDNWNREPEPSPAARTSAERQTTKVPA